MGAVQDRNTGVKKSVIGRREFFAALVPVLSIPAMLWWIFTAGRSSGINQLGKEVVIHGEIPSGISIQQGIVLSRKGEKIRAFDAKCTHLGCKLNKIEAGEVVCPCHGSRFNREGSPVKGPASATLNERTVFYDLSSKTTVIR